MAIGSYTLKIKELCDSLELINVNINDDEMMQICLRRLAPRFGAIRSTILARENRPSFFDLQLMLVVEENHVQTRSNVQGHMLYSNSDGERVQDRGRKGYFDQGHHNQEQPQG